MHWKQVCLVAQAFTATKPLATFTKCEPVFSIFAKQEDGDREAQDHNQATRHLQPRLQVLPKFIDFGIEGAWLVRRAGLHKGRPIYFPVVNTMEGLRDVLESAWEPPGVCKGIRRTVEEDWGWGKRLLLASA
jgi:hypothetical protein